MISAPGIHLLYNPTLALVFVFGLVRVVYIFVRTVFVFVHFVIVKSKK